MYGGLYEAASAMLTRFKGRGKVKTWGLMLAKRSCHYIAIQPQMKQTFPRGPW